MKRLLADSCSTADEKAEPKKDGDVEMKGDVGQVRSTPL